MLIADDADYVDGLGGDAFDGLGDVAHLRVVFWGAGDEGHCSAETVLNDFSHHHLSIINKSHSIHQSSFKSCFKSQ